MSAACRMCGYDADAKVLQAYAFFIDRDPPSLNERLFNSGVRAYAYRKERDVWCWEFRTVRLLQKIPFAVASGRRRVTLQRAYSGRQQERDLDNLIGGMKAVVDALANERLIFDDSPGSVELHYLQQRASPTGLSVLIEVLQ